MVQIQGCITNLILLVLMSLWSVQGESLCPLGFQLAFAKRKGSSICYRLKGPEAFADRFVDCAGNLFSLELYQDINIMKAEIVLWSEYKSVYPGGVFVDLSYTESMGRILINSAEIAANDDTLDIFQDLCVVIDPITNYTAVSCDEKYYRYCFVKPYVDEDEITADGCEELEGSSRFSSLTTTCLKALHGLAGSSIRATWSVAKDQCKKKGGSLLSKGWRYSNHPMFSKGISTSNPYYPFGIYSNMNHTVINYALDNSSVEMPKSEWNFQRNYLQLPTTGTFGAIVGDNWQLVNSSYIFYNLICEKGIQLQPLTLDLTIDDDNKIKVSPSTPINKKHIYCYTDSNTYYHESVTVIYDATANIFIVKPKRNGYYWCIYIDTTNFQITESNKELFFREKASLKNVYAVKLVQKNNYKFDSLSKFLRNWEKKLAEYIFYRNDYAKIYGDIDTGDHEKTEKMLKAFKNERSAKSDLKEKDVIIGTVIKRLYLDARTALLHIHLNPEVNAVPPGTWDNLEIISMKPAYYCKAVDSVSSLLLEQWTTTADCQVYKCTGDYNEGVQWLITKSDACVTSTTTGVSVSARSHDEVTVTKPTAGTIKSETRNIPMHESDESSEESVEQYTSTVTPDELNTTIPDTIIIPDTVSTDTVSTENITTYHPRPPHKPPTTTTKPEITTTEPPPPPPRPPPQQQLDQVMNDLQLLLNDTAPIYVADINNAFDQVDDLLSGSDDLEINGDLLHLLDDIGSRVKPNESNNVAKAVRTNIALLAVDADPVNPVRGLRIANRESDLFTEDAFHVIRADVNSSYLNPSDSEMLVQLPDSVAVSSRRISFVVFRTDHAFQSSMKNVIVNSRVLSVNVENFTEFQDGEGIDIHFNPIEPELENNHTRVCAFWQFLDDNSGHWSTEGCRFIPATNSSMLDTCRCDHLTHFAEILMPRTSLSDAHEFALELISVIGCCMSILGLLMIGLTAILFRSWRREFSNKIWLQLCVAIFILVMCFLITVYAVFEDNSIGCMFLGVLLHYSVLASFTWMLVAAILSYRRLVTVFTRDVSHKLLKASAFSWGVPCGIVGILLSVNPQSYAGQFDGTIPRSPFCYPTGLGMWLSVIAPLAVMLLVNWTLFILIVRSVFASQRITRHGDSNEALRCVSVSCVLVFLFGLPWVFALFPENIITLYLFSLTASFQGFILFLFFVVGNKKTRDLWLNKLKIKQTRKVPVTSSTYTNRSTGNAGSRGGNTPARSNSVAAKTTKPKSLASSDNSRFS